MNDEILTRLERLSKLKSDGAITTEEFDQQKAALLSGQKPTAPAPAPQDFKPAPVWGKWLIGIIIVLFIGGVMNKCQENQDGVNTTESVDTSVDDLAQKQKRDADGSFIRAETAIKHTLSDPDSYEEVYHQASYVGKNGIYVACLVTYRAKNAFGGYVTNKALVNFDESMKATEVIPVE